MFPNGPRSPRRHTTRALRLLVAAICATGLVAAGCSDDDGEEATTTTEATGVTVAADDDGPPEASVAGSAMDLLREEPEFSSFLAAVEGTRFEEQLECVDDDEAPTRGWTIVLAPVDTTYPDVAGDGPPFDAEDGFGDANEAFAAAAGIPEGTDVTFELDGGIGAMTWTAEQGSADEEAGQDGDDAPATPVGTQYVVFAVEDGRAVLPTDTDTPALPAISTCGSASTLQFLVLGATVAAPEDPSADFPAVVPDGE